MAPSGRGIVSWAEVTARPKRMKARKVSEKTRTRTVSPLSRMNKNHPKVKIPRLAAVSIHCRNKEDYPRILREVKEKINLQDLGISETTVGRSFAGALMILIPKEDEKDKAPLLAERLTQLTMGQEGIKITIPSKKGDIKITQIDCSTTVTHIIDAVVAHGGCLPADVKVGEIRYSQRGNGSIIVQCPAK